MSMEILDFAAPFFTVKYLAAESAYQVGAKQILLNLSDQPIQIREQSLDFLQSVIVTNTAIEGVERAVVIERNTLLSDDNILFDQIQKHWPLAFDVRKEERLRGVSHYMSPKVHIGNLGLSMYHSASVPLNVGLHKLHPFCDVPGFREVHTQIVGMGKMQQCREQDISTLYLEEALAPGATHKPMYDEQGNYPWHQYETITPSVFMAVELVPEQQTTL